MNEDLLKARDRFVEGIGRVATTVGVNRVVGQLYGMLFLNDRPLCLDDMVERLKISKGNASLNIRSLEKLGMVRKVWIKGDRKDFYEAELNFKKILISGLIDAVRTRMALASSTVAETENLVEKARGKLNGEEKKKAELYLKRLQSLKKIHKFAEGMLKKVFPTE